MASEISMNGRKKIETLQKEFTNKFRYLTLVFLDQDRRAIDVKKSLSEVRQAKGDDISIIASLKVNTLESRFLKNFGLIVEVAYKKEDKVIYTKDNVDKTLNELNKWCEENDCQPFEFKKRNTGNTLRSVQEQLFHAISEAYPNAIAKKINKDNFLDIHIPEVNAKKGTHLFFNTAKDGIKIGFYCRDEEFVSNVLAKSSAIEKYSQGVRILNNPNFENVYNAKKGALEFLKNITGDEFDIDDILNDLDAEEEINDDESDVFENSENEVDLDDILASFNDDDDVETADSEENEISDSNIELDINEFFDVLKEWEDQEESALVYYYTDKHSTFSNLLTFNINGKEIVLRRSHWYEDSYWCDYTTVGELTKRIKDYAESDNDRYWLFPDGCTFYMAGNENNGFDLEFVESSLEETEYPKSILDEDGTLNLWKLYEEFDYTEAEDDQDESGAKTIYLSFDKYKCVLDAEEEVSINVESNTDEEDDEEPEEEQNFTHQLGGLNGEMITETIYEEIDEFNELKLARVKRENKFGFIDINGSEVIPCVYKALFEFSCSHTLGISEDEDSNENILHVLNQDGHITFSSKDFLECKSVVDNQVWIKVDSTDKWTLFDCSGNMILETKHSVLAAASKDRHWVQDSNEQFGIIDSADNLIVPFEIEQVEKLDNDFIVATKNDLNCLISPLGEKLTDYLYEEIGYSVLHNEGWFKIKQNGLYGILDKYGRQIISCSYEDLRCYLNDGFILVKNNDKWGAIDLNEQLLLPYEFDFLQEFCEDLAYFEKDEKGGFVDKAGKVIIDNLFIQPMELNFSGGYCVVYENEEECYLIDNKGRRASKNYSQLDYNKDVKLLVAQDSKGKYHYLDLDQKERIKTSADVCYSFINNYANVLKDELYGVIDITGKVIIPCEYEEYIEVKLHQAVVKQNGKYGVINLENEIIHDLVYDEITTISLDGNLIYKLSSSVQEESADYTVNISNTSRVLVIGNINGFDSDKFVEDYYNVSVVEDEAEVQSYVYIDSLEHITKNDEEFRFGSDIVFVKLDNIDGLIEELQNHNFESIWLSENDEFYCLSNLNEDSLSDLNEKLLEFAKSNATINGVLFDIVFFAKDFS